MTSKRQIASWVNKLEKQRAKVAKLRNEFREVFDEMTALEDCCERAHEDLESAIHSLSELA